MRIAEVFNIPNKPSCENTNLPARLKQASMAMRAVAMRLGAKRGGLLSSSLQSRAFSDGRILNEEEKAAENMYIKVKHASTKETSPKRLMLKPFKRKITQPPHRQKMEKEKLEKAKQQGAKVEEPVGSSSSSSDSSSIPGPSTDSSKNIAVFAGIAGLLAVGIWYARSGTKKENEKKA